MQVGSYLFAVTTKHFSSAIICNLVWQGCKRNIYIQTARPYSVNLQMHM
jgi:hypothetical protein